MNPGSGTTAQSFPERWIFLLAAIVILVAILAAISVMFIFKTPSHGQYNMALILVCFSLSSIAGLLFTAKVDIKGTIGVLTLTLGGTAVLWVATLIIVANIFPFQSILKPITLNGKVIDINRQDLKDYEIAHVIVHKSNDKGFF
jgi:hypothetical protein